MTISRQLFTDSATQVFSLFNDLLDDVVITRQGKGILNKTTNEYDDSADTVIKARGSLQNARIRGNDGVDYIEQQLIVQYTDALNAVDNKDTLTINGVRHNVSEIRKDKFIITFIIGG